MSQVTEIKPHPLDGSQRQKCKVCECMDKFDFHVPDSMWKKVVPARYRNSVVCLACFDELAFQRQIDYSGSVRMLYFAGDQAIFKFQTVSAETI